MNTKKHQGRHAENFAKRFLQQQGLETIEENYFCKKGEIDLIMREGEQLVFVEVKYRRNTHYGSGAEAVTYHKRQKIIYSARHYLHRHQLSNMTSSRFDVISMSLAQHQEKGKYAIEWIKNAFSLNEFN
jgi:putative endonuclease